MSLDPFWLSITLAGCVLWYLVFVKGWPKFAHWLVHQRNWAYGAQKVWQRADGVYMSGYVCPICGKMGAISYSRGSYKRMLRGTRQ